MTITEVGPETSIIEHLRSLTDPAEACVYEDCPDEALWRVWFAKRQAPGTTRVVCTCVHRSDPFNYLFCTEHRDFVLTHSDELLICTRCNGQVVLTQIERIKR